VIKLKEILNDLTIQESPDTTISPVDNRSLSYSKDPCYTIIINKSMGVGTKDLEGGYTHGDLYAQARGAKLSNDESVDNDVVFIPNKNVAYGELHPYGCSWESESNLVQGRIFAEDNIVCFWNSLAKINPCLPVLRAMMKYYNLDITKFMIEYYDSPSGKYPRTPSDKI